MRRSGAFFRKSMVKPTALLFSTSIHSPQSLSSLVPPRRSSPPNSIPVLQEQTRMYASPPSGNRHVFQPFSAKDEEELVKIISTKPRHVLKHVRQLVWRSRKKELHFRSTVTQLMIVVQDFLRKQLIDGQQGSLIMEGIMEECVKFQQHDMAHLLFRAFLRFRRYGCKVSITALRHLFDSYKGTDNTEMMLQMANEIKDEPDLRPLAIAAFLFTGHVEEAEALKAAIAQKEELSSQDLVAMAEGYDRLRRYDDVLSVGAQVEEMTHFTNEEKLEVYNCLLKIFHQCEDEGNFSQVFLMMRSAGVPFDSASFAVILRMRLKQVQSFDEINQVEEELKDLGYVPDLTGNSVIIAAYARLMHFGDKTSEEVMVRKVDTLLTSIESRLKQGDPDMDVSSAHIRAVIRGYGAAGRADLMKQAWQRMQQKGLSNDTRVFNELIKWFSLMGNVKDVLAAKEEMANQEVHCDATTYSWLFRCLGRWYPRQTEKFYNEMVSTRIRPDGALFTTLIGVFGDLEQFDRVEQLREDMKKREENGTLQIYPVTYAVLLRVYAKNIEKVEEIFREAQQKSVADHNHVLVAMLHAYATREDGAERLESILSTIPQWSTDVYNVLLHMHGKRGQKEKVAELLERMNKENVEYNEFTFGTLVTVFGRWKQVDKLQEVLDLLKTRESMISASFYSILAATYSRLGSSEGIDDAWDDLVSSKLFPDTEVYNQFLTLYSKNHNVHKMQLVMDNMLKHVPPNPVTATTVVDMLGKAGRISDMESLLEDMSQSSDTAPTVVTYHQVMNAYAKTGDVFKMEKIRDQLVAKGFKENKVTYNILADGYGRAKRFEQLQELISRREEAGVPMDELGYCVLIAAYGRIRLGSEIQKIAEKLKTEGNSTVLTRKVHWALVDAFCRCNEIQSMEEWISALEPDMNGNEKMSIVAYYCRAGLMDKVESCVADLEASGVDVSYNALNAIARGYARAGRFDKTVETLHKMRDRGFVPDASTALNLSGAFLKAGLHEQAQQIVQWRRQYAKSHVEDPEEVIV